jgi:hypothetical protein
MDVTESTSKRKRSGKAREEAKARAIARAEEAAKEAELEGNDREVEKESVVEDGEGGDVGDGEEAEVEEDASKRVPDLELIRKRIVSYLAEISSFVRTLDSS